MISYLKGQPVIAQVAKQEKATIVVNNVGYQVFVGSKALSFLRRKSQEQKEVELFIYTHVREDALELYGFRSRKQQYLFELMLDVSGVGPKTALAIVDRSPEQIITAVQQAQVSFFKQVPRVGKKTAQKIILELKSKLGSIKELSLGPRSGQEQDVYDALVALGYEETDAGDVISQLDLDELSTEEAVKQALKKIGG